MDISGENKRKMANTTRIIGPAFLLRAYTQGIFPMSLEDGEIGWFCPDPRGVIPLESFHVPHGLKRFLKKSPFKIKVNTCFREVIERCSDRDETWIDDVILESYCTLHDLGYGHSIEVWEDGELVGGLYGVALGGAFFGESMFSRVSNASGAALVYLVERLKSRGFILLETQWTTSHLERFGAVEIPKKAYLAQLGEAMDLKCRFTRAKRPLLAKDLIH